MLGASSAFAYDPQFSASLHTPARGTIDVAFSPWDDTEGLLLKTIASAQHLIYVQAYVFTSQPLARALIDARERGVRIQVLADANQLSRGKNGQIPNLASAGIPVALETKYSAAHNKVMIIDPDRAGGIVVTGSYNFTYSAHAKNAENLIVLRGNPSVTQAYLSNWQRHRAEATPYDLSTSRQKQKQGTDYKLPHWLKF